MQSVWLDAFTQSWRQHLNVHVEATDECCSYLFPTESLETSTV